MYERHSMMNRPAAGGSHLGAAWQGTKKLVQYVFPIGKALFSYLRLLLVLPVSSLLF